MTIRIVVATCAVASLAANAGADTWRVGGRDGDFPRITPAIAAAGDGDTIRVAPGVYREDLTVSKRLKIVGVGRPRLIGTGSGTVVIISASGTEISGFLIEGSGTGQTNAMDAAIQITSSDNRIAGNILRRVFYGIVVVNGSRNQIVDNEIHGLRERSFGRRGDGIYVYRAPESIIARNRITAERDAIYFQYAPGGTAVDNIVSDSRYGLHDMFSDDTLIAGNEFSGSAVGANIMNSRRIRLERNRILRNRGVPGVGLALKDCDDAIARDNTLAGNARGLLIEGSSANQFVGNIFRWNDTAVTLFSSAERNAFSRNTFDGNWSDVVLRGRDSGTRWSIDGAGNVWDKYRGFDFDDDGVGETAHPVVGAFEHIEGGNAAARLFLQSPAAAGLELAHRLRGGVAADGFDERPLTRRSRRQTSNASPGPALLLFAAAFAAISWRGVCSR